MRIGVDIDEVLAHYIDKFFEFVHLETGRKFRKEDVHAFDLWEVIEVNPENEQAVHDSFYESSMFDKILPVERAPESMEYLVSSHNVYVITARPSRMNTKTLAWFNRHIPHIKEVIYTDQHGRSGNKLPKDKICSKLGIEVMIEDRGDYLLPCHQLGIHSILFNKPWNTSPEYDSLTRVNSWSQALKEIERIEANNA